MISVDQLTPLAFAQHLATGFRQSGAAAVMAARFHWRRLDATVLRLFEEQATLATQQAAALVPFGP